MSDKTMSQAEIRARRREVWIGLCLIAVAALLAFAAIPLGVTRPTSVSSLPLSPVFLPYLLSALIGVFAILHIVAAFTAPHSPVADSDDGALHPRWLLRGALVAILLLGYLMLPQFIGMFPTAIALTVALMRLGGERRLPVLAVFGVLLPLVIYLFFVFIAQVPMPTGVFGDWR